MIERLRLDGYQSFGQGDGFNSAIRKGFAANVDDLAAEIKSGQVNVCRSTVVLDDCNITACEFGVFPIAVGDNVSNAKIIACNVVVPVLLQIKRKCLRGKIHVHILGSQERKASDVFHGCGNGDLGKIQTVIECVSSHVFHAVGDIETGQTFTETEGKVVNVCQFSIAKIDGGQFSHAL